MEFRRAAPGDVGEIMEIIGAAQAFMRESGLPQWQDGYPTKEIIEADVEAGVSYVLTDAGVIVGTAAVTFQPEPSYEALAEGAWMGEGPYAAVHRVAVRAGGRQKGTGTAIFGYAGDLVRAAGVFDMRGDTHRDNFPMRGLLEKCGFVRRGSILLLDSVEKDRHRVVYQKLLR